MPWIENDNIQIDLPSFGFFERKEIYEKIMIFLKSINPICFVFGKKGAGKTTFIKELFNGNESNSYWLDPNFQNKKTLLEIPQKEKLVLIIDNYELSKKCIRILTWVLSLLDLDNPQFKLILISDSMDVIDYMDILYINHLEEISNFYQVHKINFDLFPPKTEEIIKHMKSNSNYTKNQLNKILKIGANSFNEISFLDKILVDIIDNDKISNDLIKSLFNKEWKNVVKNALDEYNNKESKIRNALFSLALNEKKTVRELKPILKQTLIENNFITIKNSHMELTSEILRNLILEEKILHERSDELIKRDITKILIKNPIQYVKISLKLLALNEVKFEWLITEILNSELKSVSFRDKIKAVVLLLRNIVVNDNMTEKALNYAEEFYFSVFADIKTDFENSVNSLSQLLILSNMVNPKIVFVGFQEIMYDCRSKNYSEKAIEDFVWIYINYFVRSIPNLTQLVDLLQSLIEENRISEISRTKNLHIIALFMGYNEQYNESFEILFNYLEKVKLEDNFLPYRFLVTISGVMNHYKVNKKQLNYLNEMFNSVKLKASESIKHLKTATAIDANLSLQLENYQEKITKMKDLIYTAEKQNYTDVLAALYDKFADLLKHKGNYQESQIYFEKSLQLTDGLNYEYGNAITANKMANVFLEKGDLQNAEKNFLLAMHYSDIENSPREYIDSALKLSKIKNQQGKRDESEILVDRAYKRAKMWGDLDLQYACIGNQGFNALKIGNFELFVERIETAKKFDEKIKLKIDEKAYLDFSIVLGKYMLNKNVTGLISNFKANYSNCYYRPEIYFTLTDFIIVTNKIEREIFEFIQYIINKIEKRGILLDFVNHLFFELKNSNKSIEEIRNQKLLMNVLKYCKSKFDIKNEYHLVFAFLTKQVEEYDDYTALEMKKEFEKIKSRSVFELLIKIDQEDKDISLLPFLMTSRELDFNKIKNIEERIDSMIIQMSALNKTDDLFEAMKLAEKIISLLPEIKGSLFDTKILFFIKEYSEIMHKLNENGKAIEIIVSIYNTIKEILSPNEDATIQFLLAEHYIKEDDFVNIENILQNTQDYSLNNENDIRFLSINSRYLINKKNFLEAKSFIRRMITTCSIDSNLRKISLLLAIDKYLKFANLISDDKDIIRFYLDYYIIPETFIYVNHASSFSNIVMHYYRRNMKVKAIKLSLEFADFYKKIEEIATKPFYFWAIRACNELHIDFNDLINIVNKHNVQNTVFDFLIKYYIIQYKREKNEYEEIIELLQEMIEILAELEKSSIMLITIDMWATILGFLASLHLSPFPKEKIKKLALIIKNLSFKKQIDSWLKSAFSFISSILNDSSVENRNQINTDLINSKTIPLIIKETMGLAIIGKKNPLIVEKRLKEDLLVFEKRSNIQGILRTLKELCDIYVEISNSKELEKNRKKLNKLSKEKNNEIYLILSDYYKAQYYFMIDDLLKTKKVLISLLDKSINLSPLLFVKVSAELLIVLEKLSEENNKIIQLISDKLKNNEHDTIDLIWNIAAYLPRLGYPNLVSCLNEYMESYSSDLIEKSRDQEFQLNEIRLYTSLNQKDIEHVFQCILKINSIYNQEHMWGYILYELPNSLMSCVLENRKIFYVELGAKIGRELHKSIPEKYKKILGDFREVLSQEKIEEDSPDMFFKSLTNSLQHFQINTSSKRAKIHQYKVLLIVEGATEELVIPAIFDKFYNIRLPNWREYIAILPLSGKTNIHKVLESSNIDLTRFAERFIVLLDSDIKSQHEKIQQKNLDILNETFQKGGVSIILSKKEIENYIHPAAFSRFFPSFTWNETEGLFTDTENIKNLISEHKQKSTIRMNLLEIKRALFTEMTHDEFNEAQKVKLVAGNFQNDFDLLVEQIIMTLFS